MTVSILTRLTGRHLDDAAIAEIWTNATAEGSAATDPHLAGCPECRLRFAAFETWLDEVRTDAIAEADAAFSKDRLAAQQAQILRRLEAAAEPTRVLAFPKASVSATRPSAMRRWIAGAAAAGLLTGLGLGQLMDLRHLSGNPFASSSQVADTTAPQRGMRGGIVPAVSISTDELALAEFEAAAQPSYETLRAFDTMTPRAADYLTSSR